jgi:CRP/FNR family transcriptional regulator, cyclic AMP receptor protein
MISVESLAKIPIFQKLSLSDLEILGALWDQRSFKQGQILFHKGEIGSSMFVIEKGTIEISVPFKEGKDQIHVSQLREGDFFGELSLIDGLPRTATAKAEEDSVVLVMPRQEFITFLLERPAVAIAMMGEIGMRLRKTNDLVTSLASKNVNKEMEEQLTFGERLADKIAEFGGSWAFIISFTVFLVGWIGLNSIQMWLKPFDEFPFIFLNLILSCVAAIQAPVIMMSQNRAQKVDRVKADLDYQVNLKSELMLQELHTKLDELRATELRDIQTTIQGVSTLEQRLVDLEDLVHALRQLKSD